MTPASLQLTFSENRSICCVFDVILVGEVSSMSYFAILKHKLETFLSLYFYTSLPTFIIFGFFFFLKISHPET